MKCIVLNGPFFRFMSLKFDVFSNMDHFPDFFRIMWLKFQVFSKKDNYPDFFWIMWRALLEGHEGLPGVLGRQQVLQQVQVENQALQAHLDGLEGLLWVLRLKIHLFFKWTLFLIFFRIMAAILGYFSKMDLLQIFHELCS